ncbi:MAG: MFS transporter [Candidatus Aminicenantales bacterium]
MKRTEMDRERDSVRALFLISLSVLLASSVWFSGTAAAPVLKKIWGLSDVQSSWLTISVQLGFITGTFLYALLNLADIFNSRKVFFFSALFGAAFNAALALTADGLSTALTFRFFTGMALAGIYPVGMKIVTQWFRSGLGWRLGVMVGALTLGTAVPYLIFAIGAEIPWRYLMIAASVLAAFGGGIVFLGVPDGPYLRESPPFDIRAAFRIFKFRQFRLQAFGYFGHMWELYSFWGLISFYLAASLSRRTAHFSNALPLISFLAIGFGIFGCVGGGWISRWIGEKTVALASLAASGFFCALSGFIFDLSPTLLVILALLWGVVVVSDSPQFSALAALYCPPEYTGTAFTIQNGIGFGITVISIQFIAWVSGYVGWRWAFVFLAVGPLLGSVSLARLFRSSKEGLSAKPVM